MVITPENFRMIRWQEHCQQANLRDLIAATGLLVLLKFDPNRRFFSPCDLEIRWMTSKNNRAPLLYHIKLCVSFQIHRWIQTEVTVRKHSIWVKIGDFFCPVWPGNLMDDLEQGKSEGFDSCDRPSNLNQIGFKSSIFRSCDLEIWWMTPKNNKARLLYYIQLCVSFQIRQWIQTGVTVRKPTIWFTFDDFFSRVTL